MLDGRRTEVRQERNSRKQPLSEEEAQALLDGASRVLVAKGRKVQEIPKGEATPDDLRGPTGNFRAPILLTEGTLLVGFHGETLEEVLE